MTDEASKQLLPVPSPKDQPNFLSPLRTFIESVQGARDLNAFVADHEAQLGDIERTFFNEAKRRFPSEPEDQHRDAAAIIERCSKDLRDQVVKTAEDDASQLDRRLAVRDVIRAMEAEITQLAGDPMWFIHYTTVWHSVARRPKPVRVLRSSLLVTLVSDFEVLVASLVRAQLLARPEILRTDQQKYSMQDIESFTTLDGFREHCAERAADALLYGGFEDWMDWFGRRHKVSVPGVTDCPARLVEIFQRRHLLVHNGGVVNAIYLTKTVHDGEAPAIGTRLGVGTRYFERACNHLLAAAIKLAVGIARKYAANFSGHTLDHFLTTLTFDLLARGEYETVREVNDWHLEFVDTESSRLVTKANRWLAIKRLQGVEAIRAEVEGWDVSALAPRYRIARLALLDEHVKTLDSIEAALAGGEFEAADWRTWPLLAEARSFAVEEGRVIAGWPFSPVDGLIDLDDDC